MQWATTSAQMHTMQLRYHAAPAPSPPTCPFLLLLLTSMAASSPGLHHCTSGTALPRSSTSASSASQSTGSGLMPVHLGCEGWPGRVETCTRAGVGKGGGGGEGSSREV